MTTTTYKSTGHERRAEPGVDKKSTQSRALITFPDRWHPRFWEDADQRCAIVRTIKRRYEILKKDVGADSTQKDLLCQRASFLSAILDTHEVIAAEGGGIDLGAYVQACNALSGLLKTLGLHKHVKNVTDLKTYLESKE